MKLYNKELPLRALRAIFAPPSPYEAKTKIAFHQNLLINLLE